MVLEVAILHVISGKEIAFEQDFQRASQYISAVDGYLEHSLQKCIETENKYLLHVYWESVEAHEIGFRRSAGYLEWKKLLHHYYDPFPLVEHYETIFSNNKIEG